MLLYQQYLGKVSTSSCSRIINQSINQSINETSVAPISLARLSGTTIKSVSNGEILKAVPDVHVSSGKLVVMQERPNQRVIFRRFLEVVLGEAKLTDSGMCFQREGVQKPNALAFALVFNLKTDRVTPLCDLNQRDMSGVGSIVCR